MLILTKGAVAEDADTFCGYEIVDIIDEQTLMIEVPREDIDAQYTVTTDETPYEFWGQVGVERTYELSKCDVSILATHIEVINKQSICEEIYQWETR